MCRHKKNYDGKHGFDYYNFDKDNFEETINKIKEFIKGDKKKTYDILKQSCKLEDLIEINFGYTPFELVTKILGINLEHDKYFKQENFDEKELKELKDKGFTDQEILIIKEIWEINKKVEKEKKKKEEEKKELESKNLKIKNEIIKKYYKGEEPQRNSSIYKRYEEDLKSHGIKI